MFHFCTISDWALQNIYNFIGIRLYFRIVNFLNGHSLIFEDKYYTCETKFINRIICGKLKKEYGKVPKEVFTKCCLIQIIVS